MQIKNILTILTINFLVLKKASKVRKQSKVGPHGKIKRRKKGTWIKLEVNIGP